MFAWITRFFGGKKKEPGPGLGILPGKDGSDCFNRPKDAYAERFTRPSGRWNDNPDPAPVPNPLEQLGSRVRTDHPSAAANERHTQRRLLEQMAAREKEVRPASVLFPHRTERGPLQETKEVKRFRESQTAVDRTRQGMLGNVKGASTFSSGSSKYDEEQRRRYSDNPSPGLAMFDTTTPAPYTPSVHSNYNHSNHSNYDCAPPHQAHHYDNGSNHAFSCPASDPPSFPDPAPSNCD